MESLETAPTNVEDFGDFGEVLSSGGKAVEKVEKRERPDDKYTALKELISNKTLFTSAPPAPLSLDDPLPLAETRDKDSNSTESNTHSKVSANDDAGFSSFASFDHVSTIPDNPAQSTEEVGWADFASATPTPSQSGTSDFSSNIPKPGKKIVLYVSVTSFS